MIKLSKLYEKIMGQVSRDVEIVVRLDKTRHAMERQGRHRGRPITNDLIIKTAEEAVDDITYAIIHDDIDIGDFIHIKDGDLNIICKLGESTNNRLKLTIITVMFHKDFHTKPGTKVIKLTKDG